MRKKGSSGQGGKGSSEDLKNKTLNPGTLESSNPIHEIDPERIRGVSGFSAEEAP